MCASRVFFFFFLWVARGSLFLFLFTQVPRGSLSVRVFFASWLRLSRRAW